MVEMILGAKKGYIEAALEVQMSRCHVDALVMPE